MDLTFRNLQQKNLGLPEVGIDTNTLVYTL